MNYLEELKNRSIFLWHALFGGEETANKAEPVYIDRAAAEQTAAAQTEQPGAAQADAPAVSEEKGLTWGRVTADTDRDPATLWDPTEAEGQVLRGLSEAEETLASAERSGAAESGGRVEASVEQKVSVRENESEAAAGERETERSDISAGAGAEMLLTGLRMAASSGIRAQAKPAGRGEMPALRAEREPAVAPADISAWFEKDARRYDGAYEVM